MIYLILIYFEHMVDKSYLRGLLLNNTNSVDTNAPFVNLYFSISKDINTHVHLRYNYI